MPRFLLLFCFLASPALAQYQALLPRLYTVTGVAANDTLNVRESPSARAADIGDLYPGETIEVLEFSDDGAWAMVSPIESVGWVSARYLTLTRKADGSEADPRALPSEMTCFGTEPFWDAHIQTGVSFSISEMSSGSAVPQVNLILGMARPYNTGPDYFGFIAGPYSGIIRREYCDDGMSDNQYGWSLNLLFSRTGEVGILSGCCRAESP